jgi:broad specificity phosphatase PhoE
MHGQLIILPPRGQTAHQKGAFGQMRLILIRHGESDHVLRNVIVGRVSCRGLSERVFQQAELLAHRFGATGEVNDCQALLCSSMTFRT